MHRTSIPAAFSPAAAALAPGVASFLVAHHSKHGECGDRRGTMRLAWWSHAVRGRVSGHAKVLEHARFAFVEERDASTAVGDRDRYGW